MQVVLSNKAVHTMQPYVRMPFFDSSDNTIGSATVPFDLILPGKQQVKQTLVQGRCEQISKAVVTEAYDRIPGPVSGNYIE
jgi:hypothetical protein